jgi:head-tail adaptor
MRYDKPIMLIKYDEETREWNDLQLLHARVNKNGGNEYLGSGAFQSTATKTFEVRYNSLIRDVELNCQLYRVRYPAVGGDEYNIEDYDDFEDRHLSVKLMGVARGV